MTSESKAITFTVREAAAECGVSLNTVKRRLQTGRFPNAFQAGDGRGTWRIPLGDLLSTGLHPGMPTDPDSEPVRADFGVPSPEVVIASQSSTIDGLKAQLSDRDDRIREVKAAAEAQIETVRGHMLAIEQSKEAGQQRIVDLTTTNKELASDNQQYVHNKQEADMQYAALARDELEASKAVSETRRQLENWKYGTFITGAILGLLLLAIYYFTNLR